MLYYIWQMENGWIMFVIKFLILLMFGIILSKIVYSFDFLQCEWVFLKHLQIIIQMDFFNLLLFKEFDL